MVFYPIVIATPVALVVIPLALITRWLWRQKKLQGIAIAVSVDMIGLTLLLVYLVKAWQALSRINSC